MEHSDIRKFGGDYWIKVADAVLTMAEYPVHAHEFHELVLITGGSGIHLTDRGAFPICPGDVYVLKGHEAHGFRELDHLRLINISFRPEQLPVTLSRLRSIPGYNVLFEVEPVFRDRAGSPGCLRLEPEETAAAVEKINLLKRELTQRPPGYELEAAALLVDLIVYLSRLYSDLRHCRKASRDARRLGAVIAYIENNCTREIELDSLVVKSGFSVPHFMRIFRTVTGDSPMQYVNRCRILLAEQQLRHSGDSVSEIAFACGFNDSNYFSRVFRQFNGMSPRQYRDMFVGK